MTDVNYYQIVLRVGLIHQLILQLPRRNGVEAKEKKGCQEKLIQWKLCLPMKHPPLMRGELMHHLVSDPMASLNAATKSQDHMIDVSDEQRNMEGDEGGMNEVLHSDMGRADSPTDPTEPSNMVTSEQRNVEGDEGGMNDDIPTDHPAPTPTNEQNDVEVIDYSTKQSRTPGNQTWSEEQHITVCDYASPFTVYQHCVPGNEWMKDDPQFTPHSIFPVTGGRRTKEVKDNFNWLLPHTKAADINEAVTAYDSSFHIKGGFSSLNRLNSNTIYSMPQSVEKTVCLFLRDSSMCC